MALLKILRALEVVWGGKGTKTVPLHLGAMSSVSYLHMPRLFQILEIFRGSLCEEEQANCTQNRKFTAFSRETFINPHKIKPFMLICNLEFNWTVSEI